MSQKGKVTSCTGEVGRREVIRTSLFY